MPMFKSDDAPMSLDELDAFLMSMRTPEETFCIDELDGFLTAVAIGPDLIMPSEWLPCIWGGETPDFASEAEAQRVMDAIIGRYNEILRTLRDEPEGYEPIVMENPLTGEPSAADWVEGFVAGMALSPDGWMAFLDSEDGRYFAPIGAYLDGDDSALPPAIGDTQAARRVRRETVALLPTCVPAMHAFFRRTRLGESGRRRKVGRNDPCPCGSGKKYKMCCGAN